MKPLAWRTALGLSQARLAELLGMTSRHLRRIELGQWPVPRMMAHLIRLVRKPGQLR